MILLSFIKKGSRKEALGFTKLEGNAYSISSVLLGNIKRLAQVPAALYKQGRRRQLTHVPSVT